MTTDNVMLDSGLLHGQRKSQKPSKFKKSMIALVAGGCAYGALTFTRPWEHKKVSSSPVDLSLVDAPTLGSGNVTCHPLSGSTFKMSASLYPLSEWVSFNNAGHYLLARYYYMDDAMPVLFQAASECNTYYLQNKYQGDDQWIGFSDCGKWLRATYSQSDARPMKFTGATNGRLTDSQSDTLRFRDPGDGFYKWQINSSYVSFNTDGIDRVDSCSTLGCCCAGSDDYISGVCGEHPMTSLQATYDEGGAMIVSLFQQHV